MIHEFNLSKNDTVNLLSIGKLQGKYLSMFEILIHQIHIKRKSLQIFDAYFV